MSLALSPATASPFRPTLSAWRAAVLIGLLLGLCAGVTVAQTSVPGLARDRLRAAMGSNIETFSILGSDRSMSSGSYTSKLNPDATLDISRLPIRWVSTTRHNLFGLEVSPVIRTGIAWGESDNTIRTGPLFGDQVTYDALTVNVGLGGRVHFGDHFSITPSFDLIYGSTEQEYTGRSSAGRVLERDFGGDLVDWEADSLTYSPKLNLTYSRSFGPVDFFYTLAGAYFETDVVSGEAEFGSDSTIIANIIGVEVPLGFSLLEWPLRSEIEFSRIDSSGGIEDSLRTDHFYNVNVSLITRETKRFPLLTKIGIDGGYSWADSFDGWSFGITGTVDFDRFVALFD